MMIMFYTLVVYTSVGSGCYCNPGILSVLNTVYSNHSHCHSQNKSKGNFLIFEFIKTSKFHNFHIVGPKEGCTGIPNFIDTFVYLFKYILEPLILMILFESKYHYPFNITKNPPRTQHWFIPRLRYFTRFLLETTRDLL